MSTIVEISPTESDPSIAGDRGIAFMPAAERRLHAPDRHLVLVDGNSLTARCSCWWRNTASHDGHRIGAVGHYAAVDDAAARTLLDHASRLLARAGCRTAIGPMDGNTWRRYRFIVDRGTDPAFFLEPDNPDDAPNQWTAAGFRRFATYTSAVNCDLGAEDGRTRGAVDRLASAGISIRTFDPANAQDELRRIFRLSSTAFSRNLLYSSIDEAEFLAQNTPLLPLVVPELVLLAERGNALVGFAFAIPDVLQAKRGEAIDTVVVKTVAVNPAIGGAGLGGVLVDLVQRTARQMGFCRAIHALMQDANVSGRLSRRYARAMRQYALLSRTLSA